LFELKCIKKKGKRGLTIRQPANRGSWFRKLIDLINIQTENIHPGEVLWEELLVPMNISAYRLSNDIKIPQTRISEIIKGRRRITADIALRLSIYFGNSAKFWMGLQDGGIKRNN
jgi:addiction module HigA family antidote